MAANTDGRRSGKLVISDAHSGLKATISKVFVATCQLCRVHWMRNALVYVSKGLHTVVAAAIRQAFEQHDYKYAVETWRMSPTNYASTGPGSLN